MGNQNKKVRPWKTPESVHAVKASVVVNPWFAQLANLLKALRPQMDGRVNTSFNPDAWSLQSLWPDFLNSLSFEERVAISSNLKNDGCEVLTKLFSISYLARYDRVTREAVQLFEKKIWKNTRNTSIEEGFKYLIAFFIFLQNGPKLSLEKRPMELDKSFDGDKCFFSLYAIIEALHQTLLTEISDNSIDLDLLIFWIENFDLQDVASIKHFCELPLTEDEALQDLIKLKSPNDIRHFKEERLFTKGPWCTTSVLVFTGFHTSKIKYGTLYRKLLQVKQNNNSFEGLKGVKQREFNLNTYFSGIRTLTEYKITEQRWPFTDPYEVCILCLYLDENIKALEAQSA